MLIVHLRINDPVTRKPTPVRLSVTGADGKYYAPLGRLPVFACGAGEDVGGQLRLGKQNYAIIDGACEIALPAGVPLRVQATKGPEFFPLDQTVTLGPGKMALRFELRRWINRYDLQLMSADGRSHESTPHDVWLEAGAEDLDVVNLLVKARQFLAHDGNAYPTLKNMPAFSGQQPAIDVDGRMVVVNTLNEHESLGRLGLLNSHRPVFPLVVDNHDLYWDRWTIFDWCNQCHRKNGLVTWVNAFRNAAGIPGGEALVAAILGKIDAIEIDAEATPGLLNWIYHLWNAGCPIPIIGSSGKNSNRTPLGAMRTYVNIGEEPRTYASWVNGVKAGKSFVTNGPIIELTINEGIRATARSVVPFEKLEIINTGKAIASSSVELKDDIYHASIQIDLPTEGSWIAARCIGGAGSILNPSVPVFAHTSPVRISDQRSESSLSKLADLVTQSREWLMSNLRFPTDQARDARLSYYDDAMAKLKTLESPGT